MKKIFCTGVLSLSLAFASGAASSEPDYSTHFETAKQNQVHFENKGSQPVSFDVTATITRLLAAKETQKFATDDGFAYTFSGKAYHRGTLVNPHDKEATFTLTGPDRNRIPQKRHITLASGESIDLSVGFMSYFIGLENLTGMRDHLAWDVNERGLNVLFGAAEASAPLNQAFVTTPSDWVKQTHLYRQYFLSSATMPADQVWQDFRSQPSGVTTTKREEELIVTLTSYPARFATTWLAIESLLRQDEKPDRLVLNLFEGEFPGRVLPWMIKEQMKRGLEINWCPENFKVHLKYGPTMRKYPNAAVVAFDDDIIYEKQRLSLLYSTYCKYNKKHITTYDGRFIETDEGALRPFGSRSFTGLRPAEFMTEQEPSRHLVPEGVGGVIYPPHSLGEEVFNITNALQYAPNDDDIWAYMCSVLTNKLVSKSRRVSQAMNQSIAGSQNVGLFQNNFDQNFRMLNTQRDTLFAQYAIFSKLGLATSPTLPVTQKGMRIVIDLQGAQGASKDRGLGRWSLWFAQHLAKHKGPHEILLALNGNFPGTINPLRQEFNSLLPQDNIHVWHPFPDTAYILGKHENRAASQIIYENFIASLNPDILLIASLFEGYEDACIFSTEGQGNYKKAVVAYDLIPLVFPEIYFQNKNYKEYYEKQLKLFQKADHFFSISEFTKNELQRHMEIPEDRVTNVGSAVHSDFQKRRLITADTVKQRYNITKPYLLSVLSADYRKNLEGLVKAYMDLPRSTLENHQLVVVTTLFGNQRCFLDDILQQYNLDSSTITVLNGINSYDLISLYAMSKAVIYPSHYEGFGLSVLEGMSCGRAVICSNNSSLPEVVDCSDALFDSHSVVEITQKIQRVLTDDHFRQSLETHGVEQAKKFSWDITARRAIKTMNSINTSTKQLFIDISQLVHTDSKTGIQRVVRSILSEFLNNPPSGYSVAPVYATQNDNYRYARRFTMNFLGIQSDQEGVVDEYINGKERDVFFGLDLSAHLLPEKKAYFHTLRQQGLKLVFCLYDLLPIRLESYFPGARAWFEPWVSTITEVSDQIVCISKAAADDLREWVHENPPRRDNSLKIDFFHLGCDLSNSVPTHGFPGSAQDVLSTLKDQMNFLMVGTVEPRKGYRQTLAAFEQLWGNSSNEKLIIVGKKGWGMDDFAQHVEHHPELNRKLFWLNGISDEYLDEVYKTSTCLVCASEGEGFGLPIVEGAMHGLPVIARDIPVFREVVNNSAFFFSGLEASNLRSAITEWKRLYALRQHPTSEAIHPLTWKESTNQLLRVLDL